MTYFNKQKPSVQTLAVSLEFFNRRLQEIYRLYSRIAESRPDGFVLLYMSQGSNVEQSTLEIIPGPPIDGF